MKGEPSEKKFSYKEQQGGCKSKAVGNGASQQATNVTQSAANNKKDSKKRNCNRFSSLSPCVWFLVCFTEMLDFLVFSVRVCQAILCMCCCCYCCCFLYVFWQIFFW